MNAIISAVRGPHAMISSNYSRPDLLNTFMPLSESSKAFLEVILVNPKTSKPEGRGYFNDLDFLLEACTPHVGRYNFCLSNFAYAPDQIPTRSSCNQFDRTLLDGGLQDVARAHSISVSLLFKPDLVRETSEKGAGSDAFLDIVYQVNAILARLGVKNYSLDYFLTGISARFRPSATLQSWTLGKTALERVTRRLVEVIEKQMLPQEAKRFALSAAVTGKAWDPLPGLPGLFSGPDTVIVSSSGALQPGDDAPFAALFEEVLEGKSPRVQTDRAAPAGPAISEPYVSNIQGLSQGWTEGGYEPDPGLGLGRTVEVGKPARGERDTGLGGREGSKEVASHLLSASQGSWRWPLFSVHFNKVHQGSACGEVLILQCDPFAADIAFNFLMQGAEGLAKEGQGQIAVFSKRRGAGDIALASLCRHYKANPLDSRQAGKFPDAAGLAGVHDQLFPNAPHVPAVGRGEGLDNVLRYLEHDYLVKQKKNGGPLMPLAIVIDDLGEFWQDSDLETAKRLAQVKQKLREINGTLWVTQMRLAPEPAPRQYLGLADHLLALDYDGSLESSDGGAKPPKPGEWETGFHLDLALGKLMHEISLIKIRFQAHGSHRQLLGHYVYYRAAALFHEVHPPTPQSASEIRAAAFSRSQGSGLLGQSGAGMVPG